MGDWTAARANMVAGQIVTSDVQDRGILDAMRAMPRERFVPASGAALAYADAEVPLGDGRALMSPLSLARLVQLADVRSTDLVLDIACASGYSTAILAELANSVVAIDSDPALVERASATLSALGVDNAAVVQASLADGYAAEAPYDVIFLNGSVQSVPDALIAQLSPGGRLVAIVGPGAQGRTTLLTRQGDHVSRRQGHDAAATPLPGLAPEKGFVF